MRLAKLFVVLMLCAGANGCAQSGEFVADPLPTPSCHASTLVELSDGSLLAAWFGGTAEGAPDVAIWCSRRVKGTWQKANELAREPNIAAYNPVLFHSGDGLLWFYYKFGPNPREWCAARRVSRDEGRTWSAVEHLPAGIYGPIRAKPLVLPGGEIVSGSSVESYGSWAGWIERSVDAGVTWSRYGPITLPGTARLNGGEPHGIIQPVIVPMSGTHLRLFARATRDIGRICQADSNDSGITWTQAHATELPNPNAGIDALRLRDGRFVMLYNDSTILRTPLVLAVSKDADHWTKFATMETGLGEFSYPALIQAASGDLLMTYTWNRKKIRFVQFPLAKVR